MWIWSWESRSRECASIFTTSSRVRPEALLDSIRLAFFAAQSYFTVRSERDAFARTAAAWEGRPNLLAFPLSEPDQGGVHLAAFAPAYVFPDWPTPKRLVDR